MTENAPRTIDLHSHSNCSDGALAPAALVREAASRGIGVLALTDHDTTAGVDEAEAEAAQHGLRIVPGVEITVDALGFEVHVLGLGVDRACVELQTLCGEIRGRRRERFFEMIARLRAAGVPLPEPVFDTDMALSRPLMARMLVEHGHARTYNDAFTRYLRKGCPGYVEHNRLPVVRAIDAIHAAGGVAIMAHPGLYPRGDEIVFEARRHGLDGIEAWHSDHAHDVAAHYAALAHRLGMLTSGGADFHAPDHPRSARFGRMGCPPAAWAAIESALARVN